MSLLSEVTHLEEILKTLQDNTVKPDGESHHRQYPSTKHSGSANSYLSFQLFMKTLVTP